MSSEVKTESNMVVEPEKKLGYKNPLFDKKKTREAELKDNIPDDDSEDGWNYTLTLTWQTEKNNK